jgi:hypothetical protein
MAWRTVVTELSYSSAQSLLVAVSANTPVDTVIGSGQFVGRPSGGDIGAVTGAQAAAMIFPMSDANSLLKASGDATKILAADVSGIAASTTRTWTAVDVSGVIQPESYASKSVAGSSDVTLTAAEAAPGVLKFTGTLTGNISVILPLTAGRRWTIWNATSGAFTLTIKGSSGTGAAITQGKKAPVWTDGTNFVSGMDDMSASGADTQLSNLSGTTAVPVALLPSTTGIALGSTAKPWSVAWFTGNVNVFDFGDSVAQTRLTGQILAFGSGSASLDATVARVSSGATGALAYTSNSPNSGTGTPAHIFDVSTTLTSTRQIASFRNNTQEVAGIKCDGSLRLFSTDGSGGVLDMTPATTITSYAITWPAAQGGANTFLKNDGSGGLSWASASASPGGSSGDFQFNNASAFGGTTGFAWDATNRHVSLTGVKVLGSELAPALTTGNWTLGTGWAFATGPDLLNKNADGTGTAAPSTPLAPTVGKWYCVVVTVGSLTVGTVTPTMGGFTPTSAISANGTYTYHFLATSTANLIFTPTNTSRFQVTAVSVKEITSWGANELLNATAAAEDAQQLSGAVHFLARGWKTTATAASRTVEFKQYVVPVQGSSNPSGYMMIESSINGAVYGNGFKLKSDGSIETPYLGTDGLALFSNSGAASNYLRGYAVGLWTANSDAGGYFGAFSYSNAVTARSCMVMAVIPGLTSQGGRIYFGYDGNPPTSAAWDPAGGAQNYVEFSGSLGMSPGAAITLGTSSKPWGLFTHDGSGFTSSKANSGSNVAHVIDTVNSMSGSTKLLSVKNAGTAKFTIEDDGVVSVIGANATGLLFGGASTSGADAEGVHLWKDSSSGPRIALRSYSDGGSSGRVHIFLLHSPGTPRGFGIGGYGGDSTQMCGPISTNFSIEAGFKLYLDTSGNYGTVQADGALGDSYIYKSTASGGNLDMAYDGTVFFRHDGKLTSTSPVANSGSNVAHILDTVNAMSGSTALLSIRSAGSARCVVDQNGYLFSGGGYAAVSGKPGGATFYGCNPGSEAGATIIIAPTSGTSKQLAFKFSCGSGRSQSVNIGVSDISAGSASSTNPSAFVEVTGADTANLAMVMGGGAASSAGWGVLAGSGASKIGWKGGSSNIYDPDTYFTYDGTSVSLLLGGTQLYDFFGNNGVGRLRIANKDGGGTPANDRAALLEMLDEDNASWFLFFDRQGRPRVNSTDPGTNDALGAELSASFETWSTLGTLLAATTYYAAPGAGVLFTTEYKWPVPRNCRVKRLYVNCGTAPGSGQTVTVTVRKNGSDGSVTAQVSGVGTTATDLTNEDSYSAGDLLSIKVVTSASATAADVTIGFELAQTF